MVDEATRLDDVPRQAHGAEPPLDLSGVAAALRRSRGLVALFVVLATGAVFAASLLATPRYRASARITDEPTSAAAVDIASVDRRLATSRELVTAPDVLATAAGKVGNETARTLSGKVSAAVDPEAGILEVQAVDTDPARAADIANAVAGTFLAERARMERAVLVRARRRLTNEAERLRRERAGRPALDALRERLSELAVSQAMVGSGLRLVQPATVPDSPYAPRPLRSAVLAFFAALLIGAIIALARDRLRPRTADASTLSRILGLPLLAALPEVRRSRRRLGQRRKPDGGVDPYVVEEAALHASIRVALPPTNRPRVVLVHGIAAGAGAERVASGLARSLSWAGHAAVLVTAGDPLAPPRVDGVPEIRSLDVEHELAKLKVSDCRYAIVAIPSGDQGSKLRVLAHHAAGVILVARLGATSEAEAAAARRLIDALDLRAIGLVVTCSPAEAAAIGSDGFATPVRPRSGSRNGRRAAPAAELAR
jgi:capsular polysaccharide biosynthesis protein